MENTDDGRIGLLAREFIQRFLPPNVPDAHSLLYDWDQQYSFTPTVAELEACLKDYTELLAYASGKHVVELLDFALMPASELAVAYLHRAGGEIASISEPVKGRLVGITGRVVSDAGTVMGGYFRHWDAFKRIASINEYLDGGARS